MRNKFAEVFSKLALEYEKICLVVSDISPGGPIDKFEKKNPKRFINCGVSEQSMISIAAGLAMKGYKPFCYTIATFALYRPFEFIRVDLCYQNIPVVVVGMGSGGLYTNLGATHQSIEDVSIAASIPNMQIISPCDPKELEEVMNWCVKKNKGPLYLKIGKTGEQTYTKNTKEKFKFGRLRYLYKGTDIAIITYGNAMKTSHEVFQELSKVMSVSLINCHTLKPLDYKGLKIVLKKYKKIIVIEDHVKHGGLSMMIKAYSKDLDNKNKILDYTLKDEFKHIYGNYEDFLDKHNITSKKIIKNILNEQITK
jgi:transketolase